jgi:hypothetical protein
MPPDNSRSGLADGGLEVKALVHASSLTFRNGICRVVLTETVFVLLPLSTYHTLSL